MLARLDVGPGAGTMAIEQALARVVAGLPEKFRDDPGFDLRPAVLRDAAEWVSL